MPPSSIPADEATTRFWEFQPNELFNAPATTMSAAILRAETLDHRLAGQMFKAASPKVRQDMQALRYQWRYLADANVKPRDQMSVMITQIMRRSDFVSALTPAELKQEETPSFLCLSDRHYRKLGRGIGQSEEGAHASDTLGRYLGGVGRMLDTFRLKAMGRPVTTAPAPAVAPAGEVVSRQKGPFTLYVRP